LWTICPDWPQTVILLITVSWAARLQAWHPAICTSFETCSIHFSYLLIGLFVLWCLIFWALCIFFILILCLMNSLQIFSHSEGIASFQ
jgi:hypothetical protein